MASSVFSRCIWVPHGTHSAKNLARFRSFRCQFDHTTDSNCEKWRIRLNSNAKLKYKPVNDKEQGKSRGDRTYEEGRYRAGDLYDDFDEFFRYKPNSGRKPWTLSVKSLMEFVRSFAPTLLFFTPFVASSSIWIPVLLIMVSMVPPVQQRIGPVISTLWSAMLNSANKNSLWDDEEDTSRGDRAAGRRYGYSKEPREQARRQSRHRYGVEQSAEGYKFKKNPNKHIDDFDDDYVTSRPGRYSRVSVDMDDVISRRGGRFDDSAVAADIAKEQQQKPRLNLLPAPGEGEASALRESSVPQGIHYRKVMVRVPRKKVQTPLYNNQKGFVREKRPNRMTEDGLSWDFNSLDVSHRSMNGKRGVPRSRAAKLLKLLPFMKNWGGLL